MKTNIELVAHAKSKLGTPYVYGAKGEVLTKSKFEWLKKTYPGKVLSSDSSKIGKVCTDCSGLVSWCTGKIRNSSEYKNKAKKVYPISSISAAPIGAAVWHQGHIGIYIGGGEIIEAMGSKYGVVKTKVTSRNFTHWFLICDIEYKKDADNKKYYPQYKGSTVSIVDALKSLGLDSSFSYRSKIAAANCISGYKGTAAQNHEMLKRLKEGRLIRV